MEGRRTRSSMTGPSQTQTQQSGGMATIDLRPSQSGSTIDLRPSQTQTQQGGGMATLEGTVGPESTTDYIQYGNGETILTGGKRRVSVQPLRYIMEVRPRACHDSP